MARRGGLRSALGLLIPWLLLGCPSGPDAGGSSGASTSAGSGTAGSSTVGQTGSTSTAGDTEADDTSQGLGCCERHSDPGCDESEVANCVCTEQAECCAFGWTQRCVDMATAECNATCMPDGGDTTGLTDSTMGMDDTAGSEGSGSGGTMGACCTPARGPGCAEDMALETCVCAADPFCCDMQWDGKCVGVAVMQCGAECGGGGGGGDCCMPHAGPGCDDRMTEQCVCMADPFCCNQMWDDKCVGGAQQCMGC